MKIKYLFIIALMFLICGCNLSAEGISKTKTDNKEIVVETLFTYKGYEVVRFEDGGFNRYFVIGGNATAIGGHTVMSGKTSYYRSEEIQTND